MSLDRFAVPHQPHTPVPGPDAGIAMAPGIRIEEAADFLKALSHSGRLLILCHLATGEQTVTALERLLGARQSAVSQQLARLRQEGLVTTRRDGKAVHYSISDPRVLAQMRLMRDLFALSG